MTVTERTIRRNFLDLAIEARAANLEQEKLILNHSPEPDSLVEVLTLLAPPKELVPLCSRLVNEFSYSNAHEGQQEKKLAGNAEALAVDLRKLGSNVRAALTAKGIATRLREALRTIDAGGDPAELFRAFHVVSLALREIPAAQLLSASVAYELGGKKFALLNRLHAQRSEA